MPIEIKELHIRINVDESSQAAGSELSKKEEQDKLIAACVEHVMELLAKNRER